MIACTCLIPFYNENERLLSAVKKAVAANIFTDIVCINDGSTDPATLKTIALIQRQLPKVRLIVLRKNAGKSAAIRAGLKEVKTEWVFLLDADLKNLKSSEIQQAVKLVDQHTSSVDMLVLRRAPYNWFVRLTRHDILMTGERILRTEDLRRIYRGRPFLGYQLETAINHFFQKKRCFWFQTSWENVYRVHKWGWRRSLWSNIETIGGFISYAGLPAYLSQIFFFCHKPISLLAKNR